MVKVRKSSESVRASGSPAHARPRDRITEYLFAEFDRPDLKQGSRLPPVRQLAARLNVSASAVHKVFQRLTTEGRIRTEIGNGTFLVCPSKREHTVFRLSTNLPIPHGHPHDDWAYRIGAGIGHAVMSASQNIALVPVPNRPEFSPHQNQRLLAGLELVDGLILFPLEGDEEVRIAFERAGKLLVHVNPPSEMATSNFVSADSYGACRQLGQAWSKTGRRRIALLLGRPLRQSVSSRLEYAGLVNGLGEELGRSICLRTFAAGNVSEENGYRAAQSMFADADWQPDAIHCFGDLLALGAVRAAREKGLSIPRDISIVGGTGLALTSSHCPQLTRIHQPCERMGAELVAIMCERIEKNGASVPARFLAAPFEGGATTRPEENALLKIAPLGEHN